MDSDPVADNEGLQSLPMEEEEDLDEKYQPDLSFGST